MINVTLSARDRKTAMTGICVILGILLVGKGLPSWYRWQRDLREEAELVANEARVSQSAKQVQSQMLNAQQEALDREMSSLELFVAGETPASAATALAGYLSDRAIENGMQVGAMHTIADSNAIGGPQYVSVRASMTGDVSGIMNLLASIESGMPLIGIRSLTLTQLEPLASADQPESIQLDLLIDGIARPLDHVGPIPSSATFVIPAWPTVVRYDSDRFATIAEHVESHNPFRTSRTPSRIAFGTPPTPLVPQGPPPQIVTLRLGGIMGGPPWKAVLAGFPGRDGEVIVAAGDTIAGFKIKAIHNTAVTIQGPDSLLTLTTR